MHIEITRKIIFRKLWCEECKSDENYHAIQYLNNHKVEGVLLVSFERICCECNKSNTLIQPKREVIQWNDWNALLNRIDVFA